jgi:TolA-binding protein
MPQSNLGKNFCWLVFAGLLAVLAGCTPGQYATQDRAYTPPSTYTPGSSYSGPSSNGLAAGQQPSGTSPTTTTRYFDPNVVPVGATGVAPAGPSTMPPDAGNASAGPPPGYAGPSPSAPMTIQPVSAEPKKDDDDNEWSLEHLAPDYTWKEFKKAVGWGPDHKLAREAYDRGQALFNAALECAKNHDEAGKMKNYGEAAKEFYTATWRWPDSTMEEDAMFLMAESYFFMDQYGPAQDSFSNLLKAHDNTRYLDTVIARLFAIGTYWEQLDLKSHMWPVVPNFTDNTQPWFDTFGNALACYEVVWMHDPTGPLADAALFRVANAHFRRGEWEDAAQHYDMLRKNHPKSKYQKDAHLLELQAKERIYQGPKYSVVPLNDAEEIAKQSLKQFPGQLGDEERRVRDTLALIVEQRAEREWVMAQYYDNKAEYRAAREYYKTLLQKYPRTAFGQRAAKRMQEIQNEPDEPPNYFKWLTAPFGEGK